MSDLISRQDAILAVAEEYLSEASAESPYVNDDDLPKYVELANELFEDIPSAVCDDCIWHVCNYNKVDWDGEDGYISRQDAVNAVRKCVEENSDFVIPNIYRAISEIPSVETWMSYRDLISRSDAIDKAKEIIYPLLDDMDYDDTASMAHVCIAMKIKILDMLHALPSADRPKGECRTCARNADNGGFYDDGRTRCPIQEHYALLLDGYCHLYEQI